MDHSFSSGSSNSTQFNGGFRFKRRNPFGEDRGDDNVNKTRNQSRMSVFGTISSFSLSLSLDSHMYIIHTLSFQSHTHTHTHSLNGNGNKTSLIENKTNRVHDESDDAVFFCCTVTFNTIFTTVFDCDM